MSASRLRDVVAVALLGAAAVACHGRPEAKANANANANANADAEARRGTRYRAGDFVVYAYSGSLLKQRVTLREEIVAVNGKRLVIDVVAARGEERRHWQEVVTDTKENEARSVVDELWVFEGQERRRLANEKNKDLERLHEWTLVLPESKPHDVQKTQAQVGFAGAMHACERTSGADALGGRAIRFEANECPHFV